MLFGCGNVYGNQVCYLDNYGNYSDFDCERKASNNEKFTYTAPYDLLKVNLKTLEVSKITFN